MNERDVSLLRGYPSSLNQLLQHCCNRLGSKQPRVCFTKQWYLQGGSEPLDYIYIYKNEGDTKLGISKHFHYIGFGLTDIHNYQTLCRLDEEAIQRGISYLRRDPLPEVFPAKDINGFGFEITFRIKCNDEDEPPQWPAKVMQALASFVYQSRHPFRDGDHAAWHCPLSEDENSCIEHLLMTQDPDLKEAQTSRGPVRFIQLVGVCQEELDAARRYSGRAILDMMKKWPDIGGRYLISDMKRNKTIFDLDPEIEQRLESLIKTKGSDMALMSVNHQYSALKPIVEFANGEWSDQQSIGFRTPSLVSLANDYFLKNAEQTQARYFDNIYLLFNRQAAGLLTVILNGRLAHKKSFIYSCHSGTFSTKFTPEGFVGPTLVSKSNPFVKRSAMLEIYVSEKLRLEMLETVEKLDFDAMSLPESFSWPEHKLHITVRDDDCDNQ